MRGKIEYIRELVTQAREAGELEDVLIQDLEFRNEEDVSKLRPTRTNPKEIPYIKNNPKEKELNAPKDSADGSSAGNGSQPMTLEDIAKASRRREIEALKKSLLAPLPQIPG